MLGISELALISITIRQVTVNFFFENNRNVENSAVRLSYKVDDLQILIFVNLFKSVLNSRKYIHKIHEMLILNYIFIYR